MIAAGYDWDFKSLLVIAFVILFLAVLAYRLMHRDASIWRTRFGFFVERDRYGEADAEEKVTEEHAWPKQKEEDIP